MSDFICSLWRRAVLARTTIIDTDRGVVVLHRHLGLAVGRRYRATVTAGARQPLAAGASMIGSGFGSSVSVHAKPNIKPWSPAPPYPPIAMSGDWL
jgi:hypothetical protein